MITYCKPFHWLCVMLLTTLSVACSHDNVINNEPSLGENLTLSLRADLGTPPLVRSETLGETAPDTRGAQQDEVSLIFKIFDGNKFLTNDEGQNSGVHQKRADLNRDILVQQKAKLKFLTVVRAKNRPTACYYDLSEWTYSPQEKAYIKDALSIPLSAGMRLSDDLEVRIATGGQISVAEGGNAAKIVMPTSFEREVDLANQGGNAIDMPIPYVSGWHNLVYDAQSVAMVLAGNNKPKVQLTPQGAILLTTLRNNMKQDVTLAGVRYVTNALDFGGTFLLQGDKVAFTPDYTDVTQFSMPITNDNFESKDFRFPQPLALTHNNTNNAFNFELSKVVVSWVMPKGIPAGNPWAQATVANMSRAQTHVYALDVKNATTQQPITKPNYEIVPIMGTTNQLTAGNSYTINCELYEQPHLILGHLAQYTVNAQGTDFDKTHDDEKVSLVNWKVAKEFAVGEGKELPMRDGRRAKFKVPHAGIAAMLGLGWSGIAFEGDRNYYQNFPNGGPGKLYLTDGNGNRPTTIHNPDETVSEQVVTQTMTYVPEQNTTRAYRITNKSTNNGSNNTSRQRSPDQSVLRIQVEMVEEEQHRYAGHQRFTNVYLGKYFIGNLFTPIWKGISLSNEAFWSDASATRNKVERRFANPGQYRSETLTDKDTDTPIPPNAKRHHVGGRGIYWFRNDNTFFTALIMDALHKGQHLDYTGEQWIEFMKKKNAGSVYAAIMSGVVSNAGFEVKAPTRIREAMFLPLIPYSDTYQGDEAEW